MARRGNYRKVTTVSRDIFGNKRIETNWEPKNPWVGLMVLIFVLALIFMGCK